MLSTLTRPFRPRTLALIAAGFMTAMAVLFMGAGAALAQTGDASPDAPVGAVFTVNNTLVTLVVGLIVPLVVGLLTNPGNPAWVKIGLAGAVSGALNLASQAIQADGTAVFSQEFLLQVAIVFATALGSYLGVWNPLAARRGGLNAALGPGVIDVSYREPPPPA